MRFEGAITVGGKDAPDAAVVGFQEVIPPLDRLAEFVPDTRALAEQHIVGFNTRTVSARPFTLLRAQLLKRMRAANWKLIGITSATPGVGKSFVANNLSAALSRLSDIQTYLFDLDLRRASLARNFGLFGEGGLTEYLEGGDVSLGSIGKRIANTNLGFFPCYPAGPVNSAELLVGSRFDALVGAMRRLPSDVIVICDLPPVFANDDAMIVSRMLDAYLLVIEEGVTTKKQVREAMRLLAPSPCIGTVLNRFVGGIGDNYGYGYGMKYGSYYDG